MRSLNLKITDPQLRLVYQPVCHQLGPPLLLLANPALHRGENPGVAFPRVLFQWESGSGPATAMALHKIQKF